MRADNGKKMAVFGVLGAAGCLIGWLVGEGFLWAALPAKKADGAPSLAQKPEPPPPLKNTDSLRPGAPALPEVKALPPPPKPSADFQQFFDRTGARTGEIQLSLRWWNDDDLDLHCVDPNGEEIYHASKRASRSKGHLDVDMHVSAPYSTDPGENIYWPTGEAPFGSYRVYVHLYKRRAASPKGYKVRAQVGSDVKEFEGNLTVEREKRLIHTFELKPGLRLAVAPEIIVNQGGKNTVPIAVGRDRFNGPVRVRFEGNLDGLTLNEVAIPADVRSTEAEVRADRTAQPGTRALTVVAEGGGTTTREPLRVIVKELPVALRISASSEVSVLPGGKNQLQVLIARDYFEGPVTLTWKGHDQSLKLKEALIPADRADAELEVEADLTAIVGSRDFTIRGVSVDGKVSGECAVKVIVLSGAGARRWSWLMVFIIGAWTALLAVGLSLSLVVGQNRHLGRPALPGNQAGTVIGGGLAAGLAAGVVGQSLYGLLDLSGVLPQLGFLVGWLMLGALVGRGLVFFIPNLDPLRATGAGTAGGLLGALVFIVVSPLGSGAGRFMGAAILGASIGLVVVLVEMTFRKAWLQVCRSPKEVITVNLGERAVTIGSDGKACTVYVMGVAPMAYRYKFRGGKVTCEDLTANTSQTVGAGHRQMIGKVEVTVCGGAGEPAPPKVVASTAPARMQAPIPVPPPAPKPAANPNGCPGCGRPAPGLPGKRFCMICDRTF